MTKTSFYKASKVKLLPGTERELRERNWWIDELTKYKIDNAIVSTFTLCHISHDFGVVVMEDGYQVGIPFECMEVME